MQRRPEASAAAVHAPPERQRVTWPTAWSALLVVWSGLLLGLLAYLERGEARILPPLLAAAVGVLGVWRPRPLVGPLTGVAATAVFAALRGWVDGTDGLAIVVGVVGLALVGVGALAEVLSRSMVREAANREHDQLLIEELTPTRLGTGALKWDHARKQLEDELTRARRYQHPVSLALLAFDDWDAVVRQLGPDSAAALLPECTRLLLGQLRPSDRIALIGEAELALVLPHTPLAGALVAVQKLLEVTSRELGVQLRAGIGEFPTDAATVDALVAEARGALELATLSGLPAASRTVLGTGTPHIRRIG